MLLMRYAKGFDDSKKVQQAPNLPNHFAWTMGHLALTLNRMAERLDGKALPEGEFIKADGNAGDLRRFDTESVSINSKPIPDAAKYPGTDRCVEIFSNSVDRCAVAFETATEGQLDALTKFGQIDVPMWTVAIRMVFHNGTHTGQLADLRRALGMGSIFS